MSAPTLWKHSNKNDIHVKIKIKTPWPEVLR
jgi:hypothetical protein